VATAASTAVPLGATLHARPVGAGDARVRPQRRAHTRRWQRYGVVATASTWGRARDDRVLNLLPRLGGGVAGRGHWRWVPPGWGGGWTRTLVVGRGLGGTRTPHTFPTAMGAGGVWHPAAAIDADAAVGGGSPCRPPVRRQLVKRNRLCCQCLRLGGGGGAAAVATSTATSVRGARVGGRRRD